MAKPEIIKRVNDLLARAADAGASEEERRTCAAIAARLIREHGISVGAAEAHDVEASPPGATRVHAVIDHARSVVDIAKSARAGLDSAFGFDVFGYAQNLLRERAQAEITAVMTSTPRRARPRARAKRKRA